MSVTSDHDRPISYAASTDLEVGAATYDKLVRIGWMLDCTPAAALEEVISQFKFESTEHVTLEPVSSSINLVIWGLLLAWLTLVVVGLHFLLVKVIIPHV